MSNTIPTDPTPIATSIPAIRFREAYDELIEEIQAVDEADVIPVFTDLAAATIRVHAHLPAMLSLRDRLATLDDFDITQLDRLERYTLAAAQSHVNHKLLTAPNQSAQELYAGLLKHRANFIAVAKVLESNELLDASTVKNLGAATNHQSLAFDVMTLAQLFRNAWAKINGKSPITEHLLLDAEDLASRMFVVVGAKGRDPETLGAAALTRRKAFTLFAKAYDEVQRGVTYLRWRHRDAESYAPSLAGPRKSRSGDDKGEEQPEGVEAPTNVAPANGVQQLTTVSSPIGFPNSNPISG